MNSKDQCYMLHIKEEDDDCVICEKFYAKSPNDALDDFYKWSAHEYREMELVAMFDYDEFNERYGYKHKLAWG